uniref:Uncharacterized protein n=1 Tax=Romanomermis culicivorax TaxID=13658 RepID=A0A915JU37_ROMCU
MIDPTIPLDFTTSVLKEMAVFTVSIGRGIFRYERNFAKGKEQEPSIYPIYCFASRSSDDS